MKLILPFKTIPLKAVYAPKLKASLLSISQLS